VRTPHNLVICYRAVMPTAGKVTAVLLLYWPCVMNSVVSDGLEGPKKADEHAIYTLLEMKYGRPTLHYY